MVQVHVGAPVFVPECEAARAPGLSSRAIAGASPAGDTSFNVGHDVAAASRAVNAAGPGASPAGQPNFKVPLAEQLRRRFAEPQRRVRLLHGTPFRFTRQ